MISRARCCVVAALTAACAMAATELRAQAADPDSGLVGLWKAKRRFGPEARGPLLLTRSGNGYTADFMGFAVPARMSGGELAFELPDGLGRFRGKPRPGGGFRGLWSPGEINTATPVTLLPDGPGRWAGQVVPLDDEQTFWLRVTRRPDGSLAAFLRNLERDYGGLLGIRGLVRSGDSIYLAGGRGQGRDTLVIGGTIDTARQVITLVFPNRGGSYDFSRDDDALSAFYPRGRGPARYVYRVPPALHDGWPTASLDAEGIDRAAVERAVQQVLEMGMDSINAPQVHAVLVARHGRLVLEEYFHGERRDRLHNERSASKSVTATTIGAAMLAGTPVQLSTPVYRVMNGGAFPAGLEPRKRAMTLEHLMTMSSGYFCDDNNDDAPGREDTMWEQEEPDFIRFTLPLPMAHDPGEKAIYCSINPNLALAVLGRAAGESPFYLFDRLVAQPMGIGHYAWLLDRAGNLYGGGGMAFATRDMMKFGQLMLEGGTWHGRRILSRDFVARASSPLVKINGERPYGLLWWAQDYTVRGRAVHGFAALGNGGQIVAVFPALDLVVATNGGNYGSRGWRYAGGELIPAILAAVVR
ncbi:MAG TPA: serine hydrolase [Longimicrobiaceae bacterium]|nr:serine hydrolase [Longimicrobiaceae bacterium]